MNRLAELAEYDRSIPGLIDDDFLAAGFTPDEVAKYRGTTQPSSRIPRTASRLTPADISQAEQTYGTLQAPDYTMRETSTQRVQDALINQVGLDPYLAGRYARDIMGDTSPTSQNILDGLGLADLTPLGAVFGVEEGAGTAVEGYQEGDYLKMGLGAAEAGPRVAEAFPLTRPIAEGAGVLAREVYSSPYMADAIGTLRGIRDLDADFLLGRGDPAMAQGVGADVVGGGPAKSIDDQIAELDIEVAALRQNVLDNPTDTAAFNEYKSVQRMRNDLKDQRAVSRAEGRDLSQAVEEPARTATEDEGFEAYLETVNPGGKRVAAEDRPNLAMGDMYGMLPRNSEVVGSQGDTTFYRGSDGNYYATAFNPDVGEEDVVGYITDRGDGTELAVVQELQGQGIGGELQYLFRKENPDAPTGGLTEAGEASLRKTYQRLADEGVVGADVVGDRSFDVTRKDASGIFGQGTERVRYTDPASGGTMEVVVRPDGSASVLELEVPEEFRGQGIGQSLQDKVMQDFPMMGGQVSSKAAATTAYRLGRRPAGKPNATLEEVFADIDEMSSVNMISPQMQSRFGGASAPDIAEGSSGIKLFQGSPHNFAAERLVRYQDGTTEYIVGAPDVLPDVPAGAEVVEDFPLGRMRSDKIGTGEGAQAYGYGLYGAENEGIARSYRDALSKDIPLPADDYNANIYDLVVRRNMGEDAAMKLFQDMKENSPEASENFMQMVQGNIDALESGSWKQYQPPGSMYEVNVNASPEEFLDWDTPFRELPQWQQESIERILKETEKPATPQQIEEIQGFLDELDLPSDYGATYDPMEKIHGGGALGSIERNMQRFQGNPAELTSQRLLEEGFKGVRYLDAGSRGMGFEVKLSHRGKPYETEPIRARSRKEANAISKEYQDKGFDTNIEQAGSRNYVIFDDKLVSIVKKYGIAGAAAFLGANTIDVEQALADNMTQADFEDLVAGPE